MKREETKMADCYGIYGESMDGYTAFRAANVAMVYYEKHLEPGKRYRMYCTEEELQDLKEREKMGVVRICNIYDV